MLAIIDYDAGNIKSVEKALLYLGQEVKVTGDKDEILSADKVILPGVGAFGDAMATIRAHPSLESVSGCSFSLNAVMRLRAWKDSGF